VRDDKFSVSAYVHQKKGGLASQNPAKTASVVAINKDEGSTFHQWVEDIRRELVSAKGRNEEEKQQYNETLNRAVLGFEEDRSKLLAIVHDLVSKRRILHLAPDNRSYATLPEAIFAEIIGLNVLELVLKKRDGLEEIQVLGQHIFEVRNGKATPSIHRLPSIRDLEHIQQNLVLFNQDTMNPRKKWAEVVLRVGARVTMTGFGYTAEPTLTIRFYTVKRYDLASLASPDLGTIDQTMKDLILCIIRSYFNMVVIGPTNSGKTNLIKAFIAEMDDQERIITIESRFFILRETFQTKISLNMKWMKRIPSIPAAKPSSLHCDNRQRGFAMPRFVMKTPIYMLEHVREGMREALRQFTLMNWMMFPTLLPICACSMEGGWTLLV
jgi:hypothetical protein